MSKIKESNGTYNGKAIFCTCKDWECPYYEDGICYITDPIEECDDFASWFESWEDWENA